jgi:hypothetical protein
VFNGILTATPDRLHVVAAPGLGWPEIALAGKMVETLTRFLRRFDSSTERVDALSPQDRQRMQAAAARARQRLQEAGLLDREHDAQREIRARVRAG